ncbi:MAG: sugar ABC transporter permease [Lysobacteraceae bacterium]|nr:MAG: sugar ABC transporter permease [Xanthomonadaceae bacterium]
MTARNWLRTLRTRMSLLVPLIRRDVVGRYRGSALGLLWSFLNPLFMLAIFTLVFGAVFQSRWDVPGSDTQAHSLVEYSIILFTGLTVFQFFAEVINRAPSLILANANYVKKIVFPLEILPMVAVGSALFHAAISLALTLAFVGSLLGGIPATAWLLPLVLLPLVLLTVGLAWFLASFGTYLRDIGQLTGSIVTALMFLSGVFFPRSALPEWIQPWIALGPITLPIEMARQVLVFGQQPDWRSFALYSAAAAAVAILGYLFFQKTRKGFADVV